MSMKLAIYTPLISKLNALYLRNLTSDQYAELEKAAVIMLTLEKQMLGSNTFTDEELGLWQEANDIVYSVKFPPQF